MGYKIAIDVSRTMSGGGKAHIIGILSELDPSKYSIDEVHVWGMEVLLKQLPDKPWLRRHSHPMLEKSLPYQVYWQIALMPAEIRANKCDVLLSTDAGTAKVFNPSVVMSRDMLSFEKSEINRYWFSSMWVRLWLLRHLQIRSLKKATMPLFLTHYASDTIQKWSGKLKDQRVVPHGIGRHFTEVNVIAPWPASENEPVKCIYVSNTAMYKHQWTVLEAIYMLREKGVNVEIEFVGGGKGESQRLLDVAKAKFDPEGKFSKQLQFVANKELPAKIAASHIYIFASSCENMPNTLLEGMACGLPVACSDRGPMPEVLEDGGVYFDPENATSIANAVESIIRDTEKRDWYRKRAKEISQKYSWKRCAHETFTLLTEIAARYKK